MLIVLKEWIVGHQNKKVCCIARLADKVNKLRKLMFNASFSGDPHNDANAVGTDAFKTLFVGRIVCIHYVPVDSSLLGWL